MKKSSYEMFDIILFSLISACFCVCLILEVNNNSFRNLTSILTLSGLSIVCNSVVVNAIRRRREYQNKEVVNDLLDEPEWREVFENLPEQIGIDNQLFLKQNYIIKKK